MRLHRRRGIADGLSSSVITLEVPSGGLPMSISMPSEHRSELCPLALPRRKHAGQRCARGRAQRHAGRLGVRCLVIGRESSRVAFQLASSQTQFFGINP